MAGEGAVTGPMPWPFVEQMLHGLGAEDRRREAFQEDGTMRTDTRDHYLSLGRTNTKRKDANSRARILGNNKGFEQKGLIRRANRISIRYHCEKTGPGITFEPLGALDNTPLERLEKPVNNMGYPAKDLRQSTGALGIV